MKVIEFAQLGIEVAKMRKAGTKVVQAHGVYDRLHGGHILQLINAKRLLPDSVLLVTITDDDHVRQNKGADRPYCDEMTRVRLLEELACVDRICVVPEPDAPIRIVKPDIYVKGTEYAENVKTNPALSAEVELVERHGGKVMFVGSSMPEMSTSLLSAAGESDLTYAYLRDFMKLSDKKHLTELLEAMSKKRVLILGDGIFDVTTFVDLGDKAPKTTILAMNHKAWERNTIKALGGALFMAKTAAQFVKDVTVMTGVGTREFVEGFRFPAQQMIDMLPSNVHSIAYWLPDRCSNIKWRFKEGIFTENRQRQTLSQICFLTQDRYSEPIHDWVVKDLSQLDYHDVAIIADFGHGFCSKEIHNIVANHEIFSAAITQANESNYGLNTIWKVPKADFLCIDDVELRLAFGAEFAPVTSLAHVLSETKRFGTIAITQGKEGCLMVTPDLTQRIPAIHADVVDRIGAGDTFMIIATLALSCGATPQEAGLLANIGGALACSVQSNAVPVNCEQVSEYLGRLFR